MTVVICGDECAVILIVVGWSLVMVVVMVIIVLAVKAYLDL